MNYFKMPVGDFLMTKKGKANIVLENNIKITKQAVDEFGNDFEKTKKDMRTLCCLTKKGIHLLSWKQNQKTKTRLTVKSKQEENMLNR